MGQYAQMAGRGSRSSRTPTDNPLAQHYVLPRVRLNLSTLDRVFHDVCDSWGPENAARVFICAGPSWARQTRQAAELEAWPEVDSRTVFIGATDTVQSGPFVTLSLTKDSAGQVNYGIVPDKRIDAWRIATLISDEGQSLAGRRHRGTQDVLDPQTDRDVRLSQAGRRAQLRAAWLGGLAGAVTGQADTLLRAVSRIF